MPAQVVSSAGSGLEGCIVALGGNPDMTDGDPARRMQAANLQRTIPLTEFASRLESAARITRRPDLGLFFAQRFDMRSFGAPGHLMHHAATLRDSLEAYVTHYSKIQSDTDVALTVSGGIASVSYRVRDLLVPDGSQDAEFSTGILLRFIANACGHRLRHGALRFAHPPQKGRTRLMGDANGIPFGIRPTFNAGGNSVLFPAEYLRCRNALADGELVDILETHLRSRPPVGAEADDFVCALKQVIEAETRRGGGISIQKAARLIGTSARQIQRACASQGASFRDLRNDAMVAVASEWLRHDKRSITDLALHLGFSETSSFSRAFRNHTGFSPKQLKGASEPAH